MRTIGHWIGYFNFLLRKWEVSESWKGVTLHVLADNEYEGTSHEFWF